MKRLLCAVALGLLAVAGGMATLQDRWQSGDPVRPLLATASMFLGVAAFVVGISARTRGRTAAWMRWDHFLPFLRKRRRDLPPRDPSFLWRTAQRVFPAGWLSDPVTAKPGRLRRWAKAIGPSLVAAPFRRVIQAICFVAFLVLFHYVCWPYTARPAAPPNRWSRLELREFDQASGRVRIAAPLASDVPPPTPGALVYYTIDGDTNSDELAAPSASPTGSHGATAKPLSARLVAQEASDWTIVPEGGVAPELLDLVISGGTVTLWDRPPAAWPAHYADELTRKEVVSAEVFLAIDPLVSLSTAVASRSWVWSLVSAATILLACVFIPRGFCGYLCPLGTLIDLFDWAVAGRVTRYHTPDNGWWVHIKYYVLLSVMIAAVGGVLLSGFVAAIPVVTRGFLFAFDPLQTGVARGWHLAPAWNAGHFVSLGMLAAILSLGFLRPRFWCKYVCPSGAVFSLGNLFRVTERKVEDTCIHCNKCVEICPFDAIKPDFTTRTTDCTLCQSCGGVCPTEAIKFVERWNLVQLKMPDDPPTGETPLGRRGFLSLAAGAAASLVGGAAAVGGVKVWGAKLDDPNATLPVRPPGSVPEPQFLQLCIRCGECFKACPNNVLQPLGFEQGWEGLWTPQVVADWAGCESSCNACGQVCPTGAIRALPLEEKKVARMGLAIVDQKTCLPFAGREACQLCVDECHAAGYHAIEFTRVGTEVDSDGLPVEGSGYLAPVVLADRCVGCGLCQTRCRGINVDQKHLLEESAIVILAGPGREDRIMHGSYQALRQEERKEAEQKRREQGGDSNYLPDFLK